MTKDFELRETEVLVIGCGAAGDRAAIEANREGAKVLMIDKGIAGKSSVTIKAVFSYNAALGHADPRDSPEIHFQDTVRGGYFMNNQKLAKIMCEQAPAEVEELASYGVAWDRVGEKYAQDYLPGHTYPRSLHVKHAVGLAMINGLKNQVLERKIPVESEVFVTSYVKNETGKIAGCTAIDLKTGKFCFFKAKAVVDATGPPLRLYELNGGTHGSTGDGVAMAFKAGAELVDMEFFQFFPCSLIDPPALRADELITSVARIFIRGHLYNVSGERFMEKYDHAKMEMATRDVLARAIALEVLEGRGTPNGGVWLDCTFLSRKIIETRIAQVAPNWTVRGANLLEHGLDIREVPLEIAPVAHFMCGGLRVNEKWESSLPGLYACGEVAGGVHGANRLAGNALPDTVVSGAIAGKNAARYAKTRKSSSIDNTQITAERQRIEAPLERKHGIRPLEILKKLQKLSTEQIGLIRDEKRLTSALVEIQRLKKEEVPRMAPLIQVSQYNPEWLMVFDVSNLLNVAEIIAQTALIRTESRGNHFRTDHPDASEKWLKNIVISRFETKEVPVEMTYIDK
ncbi:MAG: FAD-binding protein [Candidatus Bathyarchaeia archaeon]